MICHLFRVGVFGFEVGEDFFIFAIFVTEPAVGVGDVFGGIQEWVLAGFGLTREFGFEGMVIG